MKLSMKTDYAARALIDIAQRHGQGPVQSADIAARQSIPEPYLDQILTTLRKGGIIRSVRGPQGGHTLSRSPSQIRLGEVVLLLEGSLAPLSCLERAEDCATSSSCALHEVWHEWQLASMRVLDAVTLADLVDRQNRNEHALMYHI